MKGDQINSSQKKLLSKSPALLGLKLLITFAKSSILDVWQGFKYACGCQAQKFLMYFFSFEIYILVIIVHKLF